MPTLTPKQQFLADNLNPGEVFAGLILGADGAPDHYLVLLPGDIADTSWQQAIDWARQQHPNGDLPTRREQALLFANLATEFKPRAYWSNEQHAAGSGNAWCHYFIDGIQDDYDKSAKLRARAVRRLAI